MIASVENKPTIVKKLISSGKITNINQINTYGNTALSYAISNGHLDIIKLLVSIPGIRVDTMNSFGRDGLTEADENGYKPLVKEMTTLLIRLRGGRYTHNTYKRPR